MSELTREQMEECRQWLHRMIAEIGFDPDRYGDTEILSKIGYANRMEQVFKLALRTLDVEQRAKQAEAEARRRTEQLEADYHVQRRLRDERDTARQEAAKLREERDELQELLQESKSERAFAEEFLHAQQRIKQLESAIREYLEPISESDWTTEDQMLKEALHSSDAPASEPEKCPNCSRPLLPVDGVPYCEHCDYSATDPAPADRPETDAASEALDDFKFVEALAYQGASSMSFGKLEAKAHNVRQSLSQPAPAVPEGYTHVATIQMPDPFDEREGIWLSWENRKEAEKLPPGTKLFAAAPDPTRDE